MEEGSRRAAAAAAVAAVLPDELVLEILARLPVKSLCRCKSVSRAWRALISDPTNRCRFAQTLSGLFFHRRPCGSRPAWDFVGLSMSSVAPPPPGVDMALSFLPPTCGEMVLLDSCNGLLLLCCKGIHESPSPPPFYVVCNPATADWVRLPQTSRVPGLGCSTYAGPTMDTSTAALGFDPSISPHFHVFQLVQWLDLHDFFVEEVEIYSSQTGRWVLSRINCSDRDYIRYTGSMIYFKGFLHMCTCNGVLSVDTEGQTWRMSRVGESGGWDRGSSVGHSQGRLLYAHTTAQSSSISIYVLNDHDSEEWIWVFKQSINKQDLFGPLKLGHIGWDYYTVAFHPDCDLIFFYHWSKKELISYDMKRRDVHVICTLEVPYFVFQEMDDVRRKFFPYVPLYRRALPSSSLN